MPGTRPSGPGRPCTPPGPSGDGIARDGITGDVTNIMGSGAVLDRMMHASGPVGVAAPSSPPLTSSRLFMTQVVTYGSMGDMNRSGEPALSVHIHQTRSCAPLRDLDARAEAAICVLEAVPTALPLSAIRTGLTVRGRSCRAAGRAGDDA